MIAHKPSPSILYFTFWSAASFFLQVFEKPRKSIILEKVKKVSVFDQPTLIFRYAKRLKNINKKMNGFYPEYNIIVIAFIYLKSNKYIFFNPICFEKDNIKTYLKLEIPVARNEILIFKYVFIVFF